MWLVGEGKTLALREVETGLEGAAGCGAYGWKRVGAGGRQAG